MAFGYLGLSRAEFGLIRFGEYFLRLKYFFRLRETESQERWEIARAITFELINIQLARKDKVKDIKELWKFPWEKKLSTDDIRKIDPEERQRQINELLQKSGWQ